MKKYEVMFILKTTLEEEARVALINKFKGIVEADGEIEKIEEWGNKKLAYEINKTSEGYYVLMNIKSSIEVPTELDRNFKISEDVMRHMIVNVEEK